MEKIVETFWKLWSKFSSSFIISLAAGGSRTMLCVYLLRSYITPLQNECVYEANNSDDVMAKTNDV